jgi:uncharacterized iron-regulated protein
MLAGVSSFARALIPVASTLLACAHGATRPPPFGPSHWETALDRATPLVGRIWEPRAGAFVGAAAVKESLARADVVVLGETHDNPDHHLLQAALLRALIAAGRRPALALEMLDVDQQGAVDAALGQPSPSADALARAVGWEQSGWPAFALYRPILVAGIEAGLPVLAANLSRMQAKDVVHRGPQALGASVRGRLDQEGPLPEAVQKELREEMLASHCGMLPSRILDPMVLAQRARDAQMADRIEPAAVARGVVLIAGDGHARRDRGVPAFLLRGAPGLKVASVAFLEVASDKRAPQDFAEELGPALPFDFLIFTPRAQREDPCAGLRAHMEKVHRATP